MNFQQIKRKFKSLQVKFAVVAALISLVSFGTAALFSIQWMAEEIEKDYWEKAKLIGTHVVHDLGLTMLSKAHEGIKDVLDIYRNSEGVERVRLFNSKGEEVFAQGKSISEPKVEEALRRGEPLSFYEAGENRELAQFIFPIKNEPVCQQCHGKSEAIKGALLLSLHRGEIENYIGEQKSRFLVLFFLLALAISTVTVLAGNFYFLNPLSQIQKGAEDIHKGNYLQSIPVKAKNEIGVLAETFNEMAKTISDKTKALDEQVLLASRSQKEWQETFNCISDPIVVIDGDCHFTKANRAFQEIFQEYFPLASDPVDRKCSDLFETCLRPNCPHQISLQERKPMTAEIRGHKSGKLFEISIFPYDNPRGEFIGSVAVLKDITEKKENELQRIMQERLATLGQMASGIAHEINNPLATISIAAEGILRRVREQKFEPRLFENYLSMIREEVQRVMNINKNMLSFVRKKTEEKKPVLINQLLDKTLEMAKFQGRFREVSVLRLYREEIPAVPAYEGELRQVFNSILTNAADAMDDKGKLTLETGTEGKKVFVKISDTGPGIPAGIQDRIFNPFFTTKSEKGGTGLGLSIAEKIVRENRGEIEVVSAEGRGTTFKIILPLEST